MLQTVLITGAGGFVGQRLLLSLLERFPDLNIVLTDIAAPKIPRSLHGKADQIVSLAADLTEPKDLAKVFAGRRIDSVVALQGLMSLGSEADFALGYSVNVDSHVALLKATTAHHRDVRGDAPLPIYVFASGLAV